jgi:hypothetical protein
VFLFYHKIETDDKRLKFLGSRDFEYFGSVLMKQWTDPADNIALDLDRNFKEDVRDCKTYLLGERETLENYRNLVTEHMKKDAEAVNEKNYTAFFSRFFVIVKAMLKIGSGISKSKVSSPLVAPHSPL